MPVANLPDRTVIDISGQDAPEFLQNVVTCDIDIVDRQGAGYGGLLTPQGKIICDFLIFRSSGGYHIDVRGEAAEALVKRLTLYRLRADVGIALAAALAVFVAWGEGVDDTGLPDPRLAALGRRWIAQARSDHDLVDAAAWHAHRISLGVPEGGIDFLFDDTFPHDAAMDSLHAIAFEKGCYVGQEVVSRMRHRGTARSRIVTVEGNAELPAVGTEIVADGRPLGRLGSSSGRIGIALLRLDRVEKAHVAGNALMAGSVMIEAKLPVWAGYGWPSDTLSS